MSDKEILDIMQKYKYRLNKELGGENSLPVEKITSREYEQFKKDILPKRFTLYENLCNKAERLVKIKPDQKKVPELLNAIETAHLNVTPAGITSLAYLAPFVVIFIGLIMSTILPMAFGNDISMFFILFSLGVGLSVMFPLLKLPMLMANSWRLKASNQMVLCVFYIVTYMRHTSNLELAVEFASDHLSGPLALDLKKILWDVETEKYSTIKESLDNYLVTWKKWNLEFVEAMHLVESSLFEGAEVRRLELLDKALDVILEETYERMLHYAQNLKSPITTLHMLGIILPILGLVILPLVVNFMEGIKWYYLAAIYNVVLPAGVYYLGRTILAQRPTGYGDTDISDQVPSLQKLTSVSFKIGSKEINLNPFYFCLVIGGFIFLLALTPLILHLFGMSNVGIGPEDLEKQCDKMFCFIVFRTNENGVTAGPFDIFSSAFSLLFPMSLALGIGLYYKFRTEKLIKIREEVKNLEKEFASALFQLGNRLGDGIPAEILLKELLISCRIHLLAGFFIR